MSIAAHLYTAPDVPLVVSPGKRLTRGDVAAVIDRLREQIRSRALSSVVTYTRDAAQLVAALAAAEAVSVPIVLAHRTLPREELDMLARAVGVPVYLDDSLAWVPTPGACSTPASREFSVTLMTSGTTGRPKLVRHRVDSLLVRALSAARSAKNQSQRALLTYQPTSFAGVQVILTALCAAGTIVQASARRPVDFFEAAARCGVSHISGTPTFWRSFLLGTPNGSLPELRQITLGGEAVDQTTLDRLGRRFPQARITHIYASTEAGSLFSVNDGRAGFPSAWLDGGASRVGLRVRNGVLDVQSPRRMLGYASDTPANLTDDGWLVTGDLVRIDGDRVHFLGRVDDVVNLGGAKVSPQEVETFLLSCPGVVEARVRSVASPISGAVLAADVVLDESCDPGSQRFALLQLCQARLPAHKAPRVIRAVAAVPALASGKKG